MKKSHCIYLVYLLLSPLALIGIDHANMSKEEFSQRLWDSLDAILGDATLFMHKEA
jgi:hypothetical protein